MSGSGGSGGGGWSTPVLERRLRVAVLSPWQLGATGVGGGGYRGGGYGGGGYGGGGLGGGGFAGGEFPWRWLAAIPVATWVAPAAGLFLSAMPSSLRLIRPQERGSGVSSATDRTFLPDTGAPGWNYYPDDPRSPGWWWYDPSLPPNNQWTPFGKPNGWPIPVKPKPAPPPQKQPPAPQVPPFLPGPAETPGVCLSRHRPRYR